MSTTTKEHPIIFSAESVRAILAGTKTMTRRVVKPQPVHRTDVNDPTGITTNGWWWTRRNRTGIHSQPSAERAMELLAASPYFWPWEVGDRLWVRETWWMHDSPTAFPAADGNVTDAEGRRRLVGWDATMDSDSRRCAQEFGCRRRSPIHMPRWASRLTLEITGVRVERLQQIHGMDFAAEGVTMRQAESHPPAGCAFSDPGFWALSYRNAFSAAWDSINGKRAPWASNPWVWVVTFRRVVP